MRLWTFWLLSLLVSCAHTPIQPSMLGEPATEAEPVEEPRHPKRPKARILGRGRELSPKLAALPVTLFFDGVPLESALIEMARMLSLELVLSRDAVAGLTLTMQLEEMTLGELLDHLESLFPIRIQGRGSVLRVEKGTGPRLALLIYPFSGGLVSSRLPQDFDSLRQLSFISRSQREEGGAGLEFAGKATVGEAPPSHLEAFFEKLQVLLPWPEGSAWHLDRRRNLLFVRGTTETLAQVQTCLELLDRDPPLIRIETRFLELSEGFARELGFEFGLSEPFALLREDGHGKVVIGEESATRLGIPTVIPGDASGLNLSVLGVFSEPRFTVLMRALYEQGEAELLSAPVVTTVNNSRATIAVTTNLPYVEDYRPVFDTTVVASEGISVSDANVALVAVINDRNFTGIVLNVTPSVGEGEGKIQLRLQPVVRVQVDSITISNGALVEGVATPTISRPIIETRFIDTQMAISSGSTVLLGGLKTSVERKEIRGVPLLRSLPLLGRLFRREVVRRERRDLIISVTASIVTGEEQH
ncbi:MAG: hypothetical protein V3T77_00950 [Planctomycetota bacterium]